MKTKAQKRNEAKKNAEAVKAQRKAVRDAKGRNMTPLSSNGRKSRSAVPQSKKK